MTPAPGGRAPARRSSRTTGVALVGVSGRCGLVDVGDGGGDGVGDLTQALPGCGAGPGGDGAVAVDGGGELGVGPGQGFGAGRDVFFEPGLVAADLLGGPALLGDVGGTR